jgi:hypothetical protein
MCVPEARHCYHCSTHAAGKASYDLMRPLFRCLGPKTKLVRLQWVQSNDKLFTAAQSFRASADRAGVPGWLPWGTPSWGEAAWSCRELVGSLGLPAAACYCCSDHERIAKSSVAPVLPDTLKPLGKQTWLSTAAEELSSNNINRGL